MNSLWVQLAQHKSKYLLSDPSVPETMLNTMNIKMEKILAGPQEIQSRRGDTAHKLSYWNSTFPILNEHQNHPENRNNYGYELLF